MESEKCVAEQKVDDLAGVVAALQFQVHKLNQHVERLANGGVLGARDKIAALIERDLAGGPHDSQER